MKRNRRKLRKEILVIISIIISTTLNAQTFSNSSVSAYDTWNTSNSWATALTKTITVSGLSTPLASSSNVLKQINLTFGDGSHSTLSLSSFSIRLKSPAGTIINVVTAGSITATSITNFNAKYRDDALLNFPGDSYGEPFSIGYFRVSTANSFSNFNGENPNGSWTLEITENTASEIAFSKVELVFGAPFTYTNITASTLNDNCSTPQCMSSTDIVKSTITGYTGSAANDPNVGSPLPSGCNWNGAKNNSGWFYFRANSTTAKITISGVSALIQAIVINSTSKCSAGSQTVPNGGCPLNAVNDTYLSPRYTSSSGSSRNEQFNLSGLTIGSDYYLVIDGNGGASSNLYIEMTGNTGSCITVLPIELINFEGTEGNILYWNTASEINNDYFIVERSVDGIDWIDVNKISGMGNYREYQSYDLVDMNYTRNAINYYRLSQVDSDGFTKVYQDLIQAIDNRDRNKEVVKVINLLGQEVEINSKGVLIYIYSDGTIKRIVNN